MAKKKAAKKRQQHPMKGHNSESADRDAELVRIAKAQRTLDAERRTSNADFRERHKKLTDRLRDIDISRQAFAQPYANFVRLANAENDDDAQKARAENKIYLAHQRICYDALGHGESVDWVNLIQDADEIKKLQEEADREAAETAAESAEDATETSADV